MIILSLVKLLIFYFLNFFCLFFYFVIFSKMNYENMVLYMIMFSHSLFLILQLHSFFGELVEWKFPGWGLGIHIYKYFALFLKNYFLILMSFEFHRRILMAHILLCLDILYLIKIVIHFLMRLILILIRLYFSLLFFRLLLIHPMIFWHMILSLFPNF